MSRTEDHFKFLFHSDFSFPVSPSIIQNIPQVLSTVQQSPQEEFVVLETIKDETVVKPGNEHVTRWMLRIAVSPNRPHLRVRSEQINDGVHGIHKTQTSGRIRLTYAESAGRKV